MKNEFLIDSFTKMHWIITLVCFLNGKDICQRVEDLKELKRRRDALSKNNSRASGAFKFYNINKRVLKTEPKNRIVLK